MADETIIVKLTVTLSGASPEIIEHIKWHLTGENRDWDNYGNYDTLNDAFRGWLLDRATPDFNDFEEFFDEDWDFTVEFE